jgi:hypothetical protein
MITRASIKLSGAYCAMAELYLTDLWYEDNAENECKLILEKALQIKDGDGEPLVDALQTMASLRLSQESRRADEAVPYIRRSWGKPRNCWGKKQLRLEAFSIEPSRAGQKVEGEKHPLWKRRVYCIFYVCTITTGIYVLMRNSSIVSCFRCFYIPSDGVVRTQRTTNNSTETSRCLKHVSK